MDMSKTGKEQHIEDMSKAGFKFIKETGQVEIYMHRQLNVYCNYNWKEDFYQTSGEFGDGTFSRLQDLKYWLTESIRNA